MRTALLLCALALAAAASSPLQGGNQKMTEKQQQMLELFMNVNQPSNNQQQQQMANNFDMNNMNNFNNAHAVKQFQHAYKQGMLPRGQVFNYNNPNHLKQAIQLFDMFYFAKDYDTFYQAACWARNHVNEGQFVYALSVAIVKRPDTEGVALPPQSEVYPNLYVNQRAITKAHNHKQQGHTQACVQSNHTSQYVYNQQRKQQRQQQQQQQQQQGNMNQQPFCDNNNNQNQNQDNENQANQYQNQNQYNYEGRMAYFCEDINMNQQFAMQQIYNPSWFNQQKYNQKSQCQNGEQFYYYLQQVLARYNLERYANHLPNVQPFQFNQHVQPGYNPKLQYHNGQAVPSRPNNMNINHANNHYFHQLKKMDRRFADAVDANQVKNEQGGKQALNSHNGVEILGNLMQANDNSMNNQYYAANNGLYSYLDMLRKMIGSMVNSDNQHQAAPGTLENDSSAMRDPIFYQIISRMVNYFQNFKNQMQPYKMEQLDFQGVQVQAVNVADNNKLVTYFDNNEVDLYNALHYQQSEQMESFQYKAQQQQLNYKPFHYQIQVKSQQNTDAVIRVFIGHQYDAQGNQYSMEQARQNFVEIDRFVATLKSGQNNIQRDSQQSTRFVQQQPSTRTLYSQAQQGQLYYNQTMQQQQQYCMPQNLMLPRGHHNGQQYVFIVTVHQYQPSQNHNCDQDQVNDNRPEGFPFDRRVHAANYQQCDNIFFQTITVYNKNHNNNNNNHYNNDQ